MVLKGFHLPWVEFIIGGVLFSLIKIISDRVTDVRIASIVAAFPIGLITSFMIEKDKRAKYVFSYSINLCVLLIVAGIYHILLSKTELSIFISIGISLLCWLIINVLKTKFTKL